MDVELSPKLKQQIRTSLSQQQIITYLSLGWKFIGDRGLASVLRMLQDEEFVKSVDLSRNAITDEGAKLLSETKWRLLQHLQLWSNNISSNGVLHLSKANWNYLKRIQLGHNAIGAKGCKLLSLSNWNQLTQLGLTNTNIMDEGVHYLAKAQMQKLTKLCLGNNHLTDKVCSLISKGDLKNLKELDISENCITQCGIFNLTRLECPNLQSCWAMSKQSKGYSLQDLRVVLALVSQKFSRMTQFYL